MCVSPLYRFAIPEERFGFSIPKGYKNGAFVFSKKNMARLEFLSRSFPDCVENLKEIPCGQCIECRINTSKEWAQRCICEAQMSGRKSYFITLTYDPEFVPKPVPSFPHHVDEGQVFPSEPVLLSPLVPEHLFKFMKDLRRYFEYHYSQQDIRFFACGEYGTKGHRPHFHILLFNIDIPDMTLAFNRSLMSGKDIPYFISDDICKIWSKGFVSISPICWENAAYTCRYVIKKKIGVSRDEYEMLCKAHHVSPLPAEFTNMSRRPGIGRAYFEENKGFIYNYDLVQLPEGRQVKPCRYYDNLYDLDFPEAMDFIKVQREKKIARQKLNRAVNGSISEEESANKRVRTLKRQLKKLKRDL